ncbi:unnamed protein product [Brugia timori]|uniref:Uncharacterized protein n=1 Tax=Brugia timori TaxID=42155 RepID=A0A0R3QKU3_9BILA|nr:unnamed protein product [Brugia timori]
MQLFCCLYLHNINLQFSQFSILRLIITFNYVNVPFGFYGSSIQTDH